PSPNPTEHAAPPRWSARPDLNPGLAKLVLPERDVDLLHPGKVAIDPGQASVGLTLGHRAVLRRAVDFVLPILEVAPTVLTRCHQTSTAQAPASCSRRAGTVQACELIQVRLGSGRVVLLRDVPDRHAYVGLRVVGCCVPIVPRRAHDTAARSASQVGRVPSRARGPPRAPVP